MHASVRRSRRVCRRAGGGMSLRWHAPDCANSVGSMTCLPSIQSLGISTVGAHADELRHSHEYDEICLVAQPCTIIHAGRSVHANGGDVFMFLRGETHGYRSDPRRKADLWVVHFERDPSLTALLPRLFDPDPHRRVIALTAEQSQRFQAAFTRLLAEHVMSGADTAALHAAPPDTAGQAASSAWLRLLLIAVARWAEGRAAQPMPIADAGVAKMWSWLHEHLHEGPGLDRTLSRRLPNYESLRRRFTAAIGHSPSAVLARLRIEQAKYLLLDTDLPIQAIAERIGYARQHEFTRAFHRAVGQAPSRWRKRPDLNG